MKNKNEVLKKKKMKKFLSFSSLNFPSECLLYWTENPVRN